ncbi:MAG: DegV family EDD domain-containing protein [Acholeplasmatales bacterium]|nr:MAG: DegV family EDD domain-containing protein [Acholeplasmatales bacterium]
MSTLTLNVEQLYYSIMSGAKEVIRQAAHLNKINVFPVPDGDTGTNLASMMRSLLQRSKLEKSLTATLASVSDAALIGARGNSGIIFAQYINGLIMSLEKSDTLTLDRFALGLQEAVPYAKEAISVPVEGTMITVMRVFAEAFSEALTPKSSFIDAFENSMTTVYQALEDTTEQLEVLKKAGVVDAGAKGFVHFLEGFVNYLKTGEFDMDIVEDVVATLSHLDHADDYDPAYRYCTEALISGARLDRETIREAVAALGDSLVVAGNNRKMRLHIHTNQPQSVFFTLRTYGDIIEQKVDDMQRQYEVAHARKHDIALVTDSIADLPKSLVDQYQVHVVPIHLMIENSEYYDKLTIDSEQFYAFMDELLVYPKSAQPNVKTIENLYSFLSTYYKEIVVLTVSEKMSGTYGAFAQAARNVQDESVPIRVIDTRQNSGAEGLLVQRAAEMIAAGADAESIETAMRTLREQTKILVSVKTLKYMVRSGRLSKVTGLVAKVLNLKPVVSIDADGEGIILEKGLSLKSSTKKIFKHIESVMAAGGIERYAIVHANASDRLKQYQARLEAMTGMAPAYTMQISTVVAMNAGIGSIAVAYIAKNHL